MDSRRSPPPCASFALSRPGSSRPGGRNQPERVAGFLRNGWPVCSGLGGRFQPECSPASSKPARPGRRRLGCRGGGASRSPSGSSSPAPVKGHWDLPRDGQEDSPLAATSSPQWRPAVLPAGVGLATTPFAKLCRRDWLKAARACSTQASSSHEPVAFGASLLAERAELAVVAHVDGERPASAPGRKGWKVDLGAVAAAPRRNPTGRAAPGLSSGGDEWLTTGATGRYAIVT